MPRKKSKRKSAGKTANQTIAKDISRRSVLKTAAIYSSAGVVLFGGAGLFAMDFQRKMEEQDLSVIGAGTPVIVQIHDPQCSMCAALQKQTRRALKSFDKEAVIYRVANIRTEEGAAYQSAVGLPHVTLVLLNGEGEQVHTVNGVTPSATLTETFARYLRLPKS